MFPTILSSLQLKIVFSKSNTTMSSKSDKEEFYKNLKIKLRETTTFPTDYLYKFIVSSDGDKSDRVKAIFNEGAVISTKKSRNGKYTSVSINIRVANPDEVVAYYKKAEKIEGIISL